MKKNIIENIMKVADVHTSNISTDTLSFIKEQCPEAYRDMELSENLYDISSILESVNDPAAGYFEGDEPTKEIVEELENLNTLMAKRDCAYLRIVAM